MPHTNSSFFAGLTKHEHTCCCGGPLCILLLVCWCAELGQSRPNTGPNNPIASVSTAQIIYDRCGAKDNCCGMGMSRDTRRCTGWKRQVPFAVCSAQAGACACGARNIVQSAPSPNSGVGGGANPAPEFPKFRSRLAANSQGPKFHLPNYHSLSRFFFPEISLNLV